MRVTAIVQKPFDVLNALEYLAVIGDSADAVTWLIIGAGQRQRSARAFLRASGMDGRFLYDPDLVAHDQVAQRLVTFGGVRRFCARAGLLLPAALDWHVAPLIQRVQLAHVPRPDLIIFDPWRAKMLSLLALPDAKQCLIDGGLSAVPYQLREGFAASGALGAVANSLEHQRANLFVPWLRSAIQDRIDPDGVFFSAYWEDGPLPHNAVRNQYARFRSKVVVRKQAGVLLVLGRPRFVGAVEACAFALDWWRRNREGPPRTVVYRPHPKDVADVVPLTTLTGELSSRFGVEVRGEMPEFGLELDLLMGLDAPEVIFGYPSSVRVVLEKADAFEWIDLPDV